MNVRHDQVASILRRAVQEILSRGLNDPRVRGLVSVTRVSVSPDLAQATIFVSVIPAEHAELALHGLRHASRHVRGQVARAVDLRTVPRLVFRLDTALKKQSALEAAIARERPDDEPHPPHPDDPNPPEEMNP